MAVEDEEHAVSEAPSSSPAARGGLPSGFSTIRDILTFIVGIGIIGNEVFLQPTVETASMTVGIALAGLPVVFGADEKRKAAGK